MSILSRHALQTKEFLDKMLNLLIQMQIAGTETKKVEKLADCLTVTEHHYYDKFFWEWNTAER